MSLSSKQGLFRAKGQHINYVVEKSIEEYAYRGKNVSYDGLVFLVMLVHYHIHTHSFMLIKVSC